MKLKQKQIASTNRKVLYHALHDVEALAVDRRFYLSPQEFFERRVEVALNFLRAARVTTPELLGLFLGLDHKTSRSRFFNELERRKLITSIQVGHPRYRKLIFPTKSGFEKGYQGKLKHASKSKISLRHIDHDLVVQAMTLSYVESEADRIARAGVMCQVEAEVAFNPVLSGMTPKRPDAVVYTYLNWYDPDMIMDGDYVDPVIMNRRAIEYEASPKASESIQETLTNIADLIKPPLEAEPWEFEDGEDDPAYLELVKNQHGSGGIHQTKIYARPPQLAKKYQDTICQGKAALKVAKDDYGAWLYRTRRLPKEISAHQTKELQWGRYQSFIEAMEKAMRGA